MQSPTFARSLTDQFRLGPTTRLNDVLLNRILASIEVRFKPLEALAPQVAAAVENLRRVGLERVAEALVPIFEEAQSIQSELQGILASWELDDFFDANVAASAESAGQAAQAVVTVTQKAAEAIEAAALALGHRDTASDKAGIATDNAAAAIEAATLALGYRNTASDKAQIATDKAAEAAAAAASLSGENLVHKTGAETIGGVKEFSDGIKINGQVLGALTAAGKALAEAANVAAQRTALGLVIGTNVQAHSALLAAYAAAPWTGSLQVPVMSGANVVERKFIGASPGSILDRETGDLLYAPIGGPAAGAVGAFVLAATTAQPTNTSYPVGTQVAGSTLFVGNSTSGSGLSADSASNITSTGTNLGYGGTWQLCSRIYRAAISSTYPVGLWQRIA